MSCAAREKSVALTVTQRFPQKTLLEEPKPLRDLMPAGRSTSLRKRAISESTSGVGHGLSDQVPVSLEPATASAGIE